MKTSFEKFQERESKAPQRKRGIKAAKNKRAQRKESLSTKYDSAEFLEARRKLEEKHPRLAELVFTLLGATQNKKNGRPAIPKIFKYIFYLWVGFFCLSILFAFLSF